MTQPPNAAVIIIISVAAFGIRLRTGLRIPNVGTYLIQLNFSMIN